MIAAALVSRATARRYVENEAAIRHTMAVQAAIGNTLSLLKDAETGQRGFALTGDKSFLQPHALAERELPAQMARLLELTADDSEQLRAARHVHELALNKLAVAAENIRLMRTGHADLALADVRSGKGKRIMDAIRAVAEQMNAREQGRLHEREATAAAGERNAWIACGVALALAVVLALGGLWTARRDAIEARRVRQRLVESERAFRALADNAADFVRILELDRSLSYVSPSSVPLLGYTPEELKTMPAANLLHPEELEVTRKVAERVRASGNVEVHTHRLRRKDGEYRWFETRIQPAIDPGGARGRLHLTSRDITERELAEDALRQQTVRLEAILSEQRRAERELLESERRWRVLSEASFEGLALTQQGLIVDMNDNLLAWLGHRRDELVGTEGISLFVPEERERIVERGSLSEDLYEAHMLRRDGTQFAVEVRGRDVELNGAQVRIAVVRDVTEKKRREAELTEQAEVLRTLSLRDELTGLYNRRGFLELTRQRLRQLQPGKRGACLFFADLNGMKAINDGLGHDMGDRALTATGKLLSNVFRESDVVARLGGDEFAALASECDAVGLSALQARLQTAVETFNATGLEPFRLSVSIGAALFDPRQPRELEALMEAADADMYEAKRARAREDGLGTDSIRSAARKASAAGGRA